MLALFIFPFYILFNYFLYKIIIKWLRIFNKCFQNKILSIIVFILQIIFSIAPLIGFLLPSGGIRRFFQFIGNYYLGIMIYAFMILLIALIVKKILKNKVVRERVEKSYAVLGLIYFLILSTLSIYGMINARIIHTTSYEVNINKQVNNMKKLKIVMVADLHIGYNIGTKHIKRMVDKINLEKPDLVLIAGDFFDNEYEAIENPSKMARILSSIKSKYGTYATYGNHDIKERVLMGFTFGDHDIKRSDKRMDEFLKNSNIVLLKDEYKLIDDKFYLYGRRDHSKPGDDGIRKQVSEITKGLDKSKPIILMEHQPKELKNLSNNVDLVLSGHTHDGQIFPLNIAMRFIFENSYGIKKFNNMTSIVTSGVGLYGPNMRVFTKAEITAITVNFK